MPKKGGSVAAMEAKRKAAEAEAEAERIKAEMETLSKRKAKKMAEELRVAEEKAAAEKAAAAAKVAAAKKAAAEKAEAEAERIKAEMATMSKKKARALEDELRQAEAAAAREKSRADRAAAEDASLNPAEEEAKKKKKDGKGGKGKGKDDGKGKKGKGGGGSKKTKDAPPSKKEVAANNAARVASEKADEAAEKVAAAEAEAADIRAKKEALEGTKFKKKAEKARQAEKLEKYEKKIQEADAAVAAERSAAEAERAAADVKAAAAEDVKAAADKKRNQGLAAETAGDVSQLVGGTAKLATGLLVVKGTAKLGVNATTKTANSLAQGTMDATAGAISGTAGATKGAVKGTVKGTVTNLKEAGQAVGAVGSLGVGATKMVGKTAKMTTQAAVGTLGALDKGSEALAKMAADVTGAAFDASLATLNDAGEVIAYAGKSVTGGLKMTGNIAAGMPMNVLNAADKGSVALVLQLLERAKGYDDVQAILEKASDELRRDRDLVLAAAAKSVRGAVEWMVAELGADRELVLQLLERAEDFHVEYILGKASDELRRDRGLVLAAAAKSAGGAAEWMAAELGADREFVLQLLERAEDTSDVWIILKKAAGQGVVCGIVLALLCSPDDGVQATGAECATRANTNAVPELVLRRLVELLSSGADIAQQNAAKALAPAMEDTEAKEQVLQTVQESADAKDLLAVLAYSSTSTGTTYDKEEDKRRQAQRKKLAQQARLLLESAEPGAKDKTRQKEMVSSGLAVLFSRHRQQGWTEPDPAAEWGETRPDGKQFVSNKDTQEFRSRVFVEGHGQGMVMNFKKNKVPGMHSTHNIDFDVGRRKEIKLRRKGNGQTRWLLAPEGMDVRTGKTDEIVWQARGGRRLDPQRPRDARVDDVCLWMHEQGGLLEFYAGLFGWVRLKQDQAGIDGDQLLKLTDEMLREQLYIHVEAHREALLSAIAPLRAFLGRYRLGRFLHRSATCIVLIALDELNGDQEVLLKLMRHRNQFESEITCRFSDGKPLDAAYVIGIRCWHTPSAEPFVDEARKAQEAESTDSAPADMAMYKYVLNIHVAKHDLANDIMHGHYAGRDKARVQQLLRKIVMCLWYCEQQNFGHGDVKCVH
jgi:hypothetical protein